MSASGIGVRLQCQNLDQAIEAFTLECGFRLDAISPADSPSRAELSDPSGQVSLTLLAPRAAGDPTARPDGPDRSGDEAGRVGNDGFEISRLSDRDWGVGRAAMHYRDLVSSRLGGAVIASHIRIPDAGPVPDRVHYHEVDFQLIFCLNGWVRLVYEAAGEPFVLHPGEAILQAPTQRHRVLEASAGLEVLEVSSPAEHPTRFDHNLELPTAKSPQPAFGGQPYVHFRQQDRVWYPLTALDESAGPRDGARGDSSGVTVGVGTSWEYSATGISPERGHQARVTVLRTGTAESGEAIAETVEGAEPAGRSPSEGSDGSAATASSAPSSTAPSSTAPSLFAPSANPGATEGPLLLMVTSGAVAVSATRHESTGRKERVEVAALGRADSLLLPAGALVELTPVDGQPSEAVLVDLALLTSASGL